MPVINAINKRTKGMVLPSGNKGYCMLKCNAALLYLQVPTILLSELDGCEELDYEVA